MFPDRLPHLDVEPLVNRCLEAARNGSPPGGHHQREDRERRARSTLYAVHEGGRGKRNLLETNLPQELFRPLVPQSRGFRQAVGRAQELPELTRLEITRWSYK